MRVALIAAAGLLAYAAYRYAGQGQLDLANAVDDAVASVEDTLGVTMGISLSGYSPDKVPTQYRAAIADAEAAYGLPSGLLARQLWQESRYRASVISGQVKSPAGALGIAQFMPGTAAELGIDPLDPLQAIPGAARYMARLYAQTGNWSLALAAYNWGIGNVLRKGIARAPKETRNYYSQIMADVGLA